MASSTTPSASSTPSPTYGLENNCGNLPLIAPGIRALPPDRFLSLHLDHILSHPPDNVLFPFLHGLEGENHAQKTFFVSNLDHHSATTGRVQVPRFRGLVWVVCEDDIDGNLSLSSLSATSSSEDDSDDFSDDESDDFTHLDMDVDSGVQIVQDDGSVEQHMHPVVQKPLPQQSPMVVPATPPPGPTTVAGSPTLLTSTFRPKDLLRRPPGTDEADPSNWEFVPARVPDGISLRNFGIQVPIYATLSDIVVYSPRGPSNNAIQLARRFVSAIAKKKTERQHPGANLLDYNVFILTSDEAEIQRTMPHLVRRVCQDGAANGRDGGAHTNGPDGHLLDEDDVQMHPPSDKPIENTVDFAQREKDEMRDLTRASEIITLGEVIEEWSPHSGQVFLGNADDVPLAPHLSSTPSSGPSSPSPPLSSSPSSVDSSAPDSLPDASPFSYESTNSPKNGFGYDICIECHDLAPFPSTAHLRAADDHLAVLDGGWVERCKRLGLDTIPPRPPPNANAVIHLPFPSSPSSSPATMNALMPVLRFLQRWLQPIPPPSPPTPPAVPEVKAPEKEKEHTSGARRWSSVTSLIPSFPAFPAAAAPAIPTPTPVPHTSRTRSLTSPVPSHPPPPRPTHAHQTRPLKILLYSADGYTESSVPALCLLMAVKGLSLPEAYLELQVEKRRSFFVYQTDLSVLRRAEVRIREEKDRERVAKGGLISAANGGRWGQTAPNGWPGYPNHAGAANPYPPPQAATSPAARPPAPPHAQVTSGPPVLGRPAAKSVSLAQAPPMHIPPMVVPSQMTSPIKGRPRANTSPWLPSLFGGDHQSWFNDPRFDGSFPSRVLPFLYLGNLNHASNVYMLHALGITHVVSVGECALIPPPHHPGSNGTSNSHGHGYGHMASSFTSASCHRPTGVAQFLPGKGSGGQGSLWIEEQEGRIKVLDIKGVCDDGIDTLEPQLEPICEWIDKARAEGGQVLVHCRVGVSRSATVTIAYVMKYLSLPLVDAYLIVRSRRLSVLIQPNMRLLYNLCGWEIKLAKERAGGEEGKLRQELARTLSWPYLAKEVHSLNEKYLH
ncbi:hypothetical protein BD779DRAFT_1493305 [Infundibulicybe gibba]|nr:hypothetical protein BD779DRAFT_1493305 [Infundibulicybe gibba]